MPQRLKYEDYAITSCRPGFFRDYEFGILQAINIFKMYIQSKLNSIARETRFYMLCSEIGYN